ncbi:MAG: serine/threonine protein kinase, bacterial [Mycobacterium sp.]|nr:serine/threonine protein kinase, bacterial [Mycobacterium sp.]
MGTACSIPRMWMNGGDVPQSPPVVASRPNRLVAIGLPLLLVLILGAATTFDVIRLTAKSSPPSTSAGASAAPSPVTPPASWQPFVDGAKSATEAMSFISYQTIDRDYQRIADVITDPLKSQFATFGPALKDATVAAKSVTEGTVNAAGLELLTGDTAQVLVQFTSKVTTDGTAQEPKAYRMRVTMKKIDDAYKASALEVVP